MYMSALSALQTLGQCGHGNNPRSSSEVTELRDCSCLTGEMCFQGETPSVEQLKKLIHQGAITNKFVPVFCGSAFKNKGVQPLLDGVVSLLAALCTTPSSTADPTRHGPSTALVLAKGSLLYSVPGM